MKNTINILDSFILTFAHPFYEQTEVDLFNRYGGKKLSPTQWQGQSFYLWEGNKSPYFNHCTCKKYRGIDAAQPIG